MLQSGDLLGSRPQHAVPPRTRAPQRVRRGVRWLIADRPRQLREAMACNASAFGIPRDWTTRIQTNGS